MRDRHKGFAKFIRKVNPRHSTQSTVELEVPWSKEELLGTTVVKGVSGTKGVDSLRKVLEGIPHHLNYSFVWSSSPQGHYYWLDRHRHTAPMSDEDYEFCRQLLELHS